MPAAAAHDWIIRTRLTAVIRGNYSPHDLDTIAETLVSESILCLEVTLNTPSALETIGRLRQRYGDAILVGAGTVRRADQVSQAADAGAQFLVSPNFDPA